MLRNGSSLRSYNDFAGRNGSKKFHIEFCTVAHWKNGEIVEEKLFYDLVGLLKQIGVM